MAVRRMAYVVLVLCVVVGIWLGAGGDGRMRLFTAVLFGSCGVSLAWALWGRGPGGERVAAGPAAPDAGAGAAPDAEQPSGPWRVYGHDTFAHEDYFVGEFDTEAEAREVVRARLEELAKFQDPSLRDKIWVEPPGSRYRMSL